MAKNPNNANPREGVYNRLARRWDIGWSEFTKQQQRDLHVIEPDGAKSIDSDMQTKSRVLGEQIYHQFLAGKLNFLRETDGASEETPEMRREYWKWVTQEPALEASMWTKLHAVLSSKLTIQPASKSKYDRAIADWVKECITRSSGGLRKIGEQVFYHGLTWGNVLAEPKWKKEYARKWKGLFPSGFITLKDIVARDPSDYRMEVDGFRNITGIWSNRTNEWFSPSYFVKWANKPIYGNQAGTSAVRSSRGACKMLRSAKIFRSIYLEQYGLPMVKASYPKGDSDQRLLAEAAIQHARSLGYFLLPDGTDVEALTVASRGESEYSQSIDDLRKEIFLAQTGSYLFAMEGSVGNAAGNSETHRSTFDLGVWYLADILTNEILNDQLIPWLVLLNIYDADLPRASLGGVEDADLKPTLEKYQTLYSMGVPLSLEEVYESLNVAPPNSESDTLSRVVQGVIQQKTGGVEVDLNQQMPSFAASTPAIRQELDFTCGPVALWYCLDRLKGSNPNLSEEFLASEIGANPISGSSPTDLIRVAKQSGLNANIQSGLTLLDVQRTLDDGKLIIAPVQSSDNAEEKAKDQHGHYVVITSIHLGEGEISGQVGIFDPVIGDHQTRFIPLQQFMTDWHDRESNGQKCNRLGIVVGVEDAQQFNAGPHKFACLYSAIHPEHEARIFATQGEIKSADLAEDGLETEPHVTVFYGLGDEHQTVISEALTETAPIKLTFGQVFTLEPKNKPDCEVLAVRVYSGDLENLHYQTGYVSGVTQQQSFLPHLTIAYLKKGKAGNYLDSIRDVLLGETCLIDSAIFSTTSGEKRSIPFGGQGLLPAFAAGEGIESPASNEVAIAGADGEQVAKLLREAKEGGAKLLSSLCKKAFARKLAHQQSGPLLFNDEERKDLAEEFEKTLSAASLLGHSAVWLKYARDEGGDVREESPFEVFDAPVRSLIPEKAIDYFRSLVPMLRVNPIFGADMRRQALTLAVATERTLLKSLQEIVLNSLISGDSNGTPKIQQILDKAGVSPRNPQYAKMVFRTNMMDAYTAANDAAMRDPDIQEAYPCWRYDGILDGREGDDHRPKFAKYYPISASFAEVRGKRPFNCRCSPRPVHRSEWARLSASGAVIETNW